MGSRLANVSEELAMSCSKAQSPAASSLTMNSYSAEAPKFIYFNTLNRATKSTVHLDSRRCGHVSVSQDLLRLLADVYTDKEGYCYHFIMSTNFYFISFFWHYIVQNGCFRLNSCSEVILKTRNDSWVAGKFANLREFYVVLNTKNANLIEISGMLI